MFKRILIANRGEIASRIISTCRSMGIETVAIFSDEDRNLRYLNQADYVYRVGKGPVSASYKNADAIIGIAKQAGCDALHPGYGFFAEDINFAELCKSNNITFVGAEPKVLKDVNNKIRMKHIAHNMGITVVPGYNEELTDMSEAKEAAKTFGAPIILKPVLGIQEKGVRRLDNLNYLDKAFIATQVEGKVLANANQIILEKCIDGSKHIEIPVLRDKKGNVLILPELDCSIQRRFQKIMTETPAPSLNENTLKTMRESVESLAKKINLVGIATFEFLVDKNNMAYFMETNARLSVEHSITEMVTGLDLVKQQLLIAAGENIEVHSKELKERGSAVQCRIYAEDPENFTPNPGVVYDINFPVEYNVRHELVAQPGWEIPIYYDHMIAKMSVRANQRKELVSKLKHVLSEYMISGIVTNIPMFIQILEHPAYLEGVYDIDFMRTQFKFSRTLPPQDFRKAIEIATVIKVYKDINDGKSQGLLENAPTMSQWRQELTNRRL